MRAIVVDEFGPPERLRVDDVPSPQPGPGEVLVEVHAAGVGPWDAWIRDVRHPRISGPPQPDHLLRECREIRTHRMRLGKTGDGE